MQQGLHPGRLPTVREGGSEGVGAQLKAQPYVCSNVAAGFEVRLRALHAHAQLEQTQQTTCCTADFLCSRPPGLLTDIAFAALPLSVCLRRRQHIPPPLTHLHPNNASAARLSRRASLTRCCQQRAHRSTQCLTLMCQTACW